MKYSCILIEDNILERDALEMKLRKIDSLAIKAVLGDGMEAISVLKSTPIDIVFSDIDMPDLSGIELLKSLKNPPIFIFISSHPEHAAESFALDVIDYLVKPVKIERLIKATDKAIEYISVKRKIQPDTNARQQALPVTDYIRIVDSEDYFFIKEKNAYVKMNMGDVLYIESMGDFSKIITLQQKTHFALIGLKNLEKQLPEKLFMRVHKQYIINLMHIQHITTTDIVLNNKMVIPVSSAYKQGLQDNLIAKKTLTRFTD